VLDVNAIVRDAFHLQAKVDELSAEIKEKSAAGHVPRLPFSEVLDKWAKVTITEVIFFY
jgi:hypothetical protein